MTFRRFLLIDALTLDAAGAAAILTGATALGVVLLVVAALVFGGWVVTGHRHPVAA